MVKKKEGTKAHGERSATTQSRKTVHNHGHDTVVEAATDTIDGFWHSKRWDTGSS